MYCPDSWSKAGIAVDFETAGALENLHLAIARRLWADVVIDGEQIGKRPIRLVLDDVASDAAVSGERIDAKPIAPVEGNQIAIRLHAHWKGLPG